MKQKQKDYSTEIERLEDKINHLGIWNFVYSLVLIVLIITVAIISNNVYFVLSTMPQRVCENITLETEYNNSIISSVDFMSNYFPSGNGELNSIETCINHKCTKKFWKEICIIK